MKVSMGNNRRYGYWAFAGMAFLILFLLERPIGIHVDENNYLNFAQSAPLGDSLFSGKPYIFYLFNYSMYHLLGVWFGNLKPLSLHLIYSCLSLLSLLWMIHQIEKTSRKGAGIFYSLLFFSPLFLLNSTQVMMETPVLILLNISLGGLFGLQRAPNSSKFRWITFTSACLAILFKDSAMVAILMLILTFGWKNFHPRTENPTAKMNKNCFPLVGALLVALILNALMKKFTNLPNHPFGNFKTLFFPRHWISQTAKTYDFLSIWLFYLWPPSLIAGSYYLLSNRQNENSENSQTRFFIRLVFLSFLGTLIVQFASGLHFARYTYPVLWLGLIGTSWLASQMSRPIAILIAFSYFFPVGNLWVEHLDRMNLWPSFVKEELYHSYFTVFPGVPLHHWIAFSSAEREKPCIFIPKKLTVNREAMITYLEWITHSPQFFDETTLSVISECPGPKIYAYREAQTLIDDCHVPCPTGNFSLTSCSLQNSRQTIENKEVLANRTCLP